LKILVVYDSVFGNSERIARAIDSVLTGNEVKVVSVQEFGLEDLAGLEMMIVGGPTQSWTSTVAMNGFIHGLAEGALEGVKLATFDTRVRSILSGSAAPKIEKALRKKGAQAIAPPIGFFVKGRSGPLVDGEVERAAGWAKHLMNQSPAAVNPRNPEIP
jgi:flavodoxin